MEVIFDGVTGCPDDVPVAYVYPAHSRNWILSPISKPTAKLAVFLSIAA